MDQRLYPPHAQQNLKFASRRKRPRTADSSTTSTLPPRLSWSIPLLYMGSNVEGKPRRLLSDIGGVGAYRQKCDVAPPAATKVSRCAEQEFDMDRGYAVKETGSLSSAARLYEEPGCSTASLDRRHGGSSMENFKATVDAARNRLVTSELRVPGAVAMATDRQRNIYEGAAGKRRLDRDADITTDTVFAIFSTTKAITGTAALQLVEEGKLDLDAPAKNYAPDIGKLEVIEGFTESGEPNLRPPKRDVTTRMLLTHWLAWGMTSSTRSIFASPRRRGSRASSRAPRKR